MRRRSIERRGAHKSTGGISKSIPEPVDPVGTAPNSKINTVASWGPTSNRHPIGRPCTPGVYAQLRLEQVST